MGLAAGLVGGLGSLVGGIGGASISASAQGQTNEENMQMAQKQMDFQDHERSTAYQAQVQDLEKAGLNPMMALGAGGAAAPSGASIAAQNPVPNGGSLGSAMASSALDSIRAMSQIDNTVKDTQVKEAQRLLTNANALQSAAQVPAEQAKGRLAESIMPAVKSVADRVQAVSSSAGSVIDYIKDLGSQLGSKLFPHDVSGSDSSDPGTSLFGN